MTTEIKELINRRYADGWEKPLCHYQGTMTGARYEDLISWDDWRNGGDGGDYTAELSDLYAELGIVEGNGQWYESAWRFDKTLSEAQKNRWEIFVEEELSKIDPADFWEWETEDND